MKENFLNKQEQDGERPLLNWSLETMQRQRMASEVFRRREKVTTGWDA